MPEQQYFTIFSMPMNGIVVPVEDAFDGLSLPAEAVSIRGGLDQKFEIETQESPVQEHVLSQTTRIQDLA